MYLLTPGIRSLPSIGHCWHGDNANSPSSPLYHQVADEEFEVYPLLDVADMVMLEAPSLLIFFLFALYHQVADEEFRVYPLLDVDNKAHAVFILSPSLPPGGR